MLPDTGFMFEIGTFYGDFEPTEDNTDEWLANWAPFSDAAGEPLPSATTPYTTVPAVFESFDGFTSSVELTHNNEPFVAGKQGFIWGFDNRTEAGDGEWILLTNAAEWTIPSGTGIVFTQTWTVMDANGDGVIVGSVEGDSMTMESVSIPGIPVPEPSSLALIVGSVVLVAARRSRRS